jgi:hypothetical protein
LHTTLEAVACCCRANLVATRRCYNSPTPLNTGGTRRLDAQAERSAEGFEDGEPKRQLEARCREL